MLVCVCCVCVQENTLFFVKQHPESKKEGAEFELQDEGQLLLQSVGKGNILHSCNVVAVGDRTSSSYNARSVVWMLVRGLRSN
jgi:hypothetical protein